MSVVESGFVTPVDLDRDAFMRRLVSGLGRLNEAILGSDVAGAYVMTVGLSMGSAIEAEYKRFWGIDRPFTLDEYAHVIVDLKQKIQGNFSIVSKEPEKVVVRTTSCPFDEFVRQSPSLCFMTSSVFGGIAARNFGYAKVVLQRRIALGDPDCYVTVHLARTAESERSIGREYFPETERAGASIQEQLQLIESVKELRRELGETNARWEEVVRGAADAICGLDRADRICYINARWRDLLGVEGDELVGTVLPLIAHPDDAPQLRRQLEHLRTGTRLNGASFRLRHRDGSFRDVVMSAGPIRDDQGRVIATLAILHDVTDEREAARLKNELLSTASHELRTPVSTIKGMTELLLRTLDRQGEIPADQLAVRLLRIQREADRLARLGSDLVDAAREHAGRFIVLRESCDLNETVASCVRRHREMAASGGQHEIVFQPAGASVLVELEPGRIEQVVGNLLDNAMKYSPNGTDIVVRTAIDGRSAQVSVTDRGIGIPSRDLPNLCSAFFRASNASSLNYPGLGLGLHISKSIVEKHGGDLTVKSIVGEGSTFTVSLPLTLDSAEGPGT